MSWKPGYQRQYEFTSSILKLVALIAQLAPDDFDVRNMLDKAVTALHQCNELQLADKDPDVWEFFDQHSKEESFGVSNPIVAAFLREKRNRRRRSPEARQKASIGDVEAIIRLPNHQFSRQHGGSYQRHAGFFRVSEVDIPAQNRKELASERGELR
ncbi:hypothetical protein COOONC_06759 [Cooperia oncophora]